MIKLSNVNKVYRTDRVETIALENINLDVAPGEFVSIMGPSGCGKSTLLNLIGLLDTPSSGALALDGDEVRTWGDRQLAQFRNEKLGFVFQSFHLVPDLKVIDNVEIPLLYSRTNRRPTNAAAQGGAVGARPGRLDLARHHHFPTQLSGGSSSAWPSPGHRRQAAHHPRGRAHRHLDSGMGDEIMDISTISTRATARPSSWSRKTTFRAPHDESCAFSMDGGGVNCSAITSKSPEGPRAQEVLSPHFPLGITLTLVVMSGRGELDNSFARSSRSRVSAA